MLSIDCFDSKKHSGVISFFNQHYVKPGIFDKQYSLILSKAFSIRNKSDYDDFYLASEEESRLQIADAEFFLTGVSIHLKAIKAKTDASV